MRGGAVGKANEVTKKSMESIALSGLKRVLNSNLQLTSKYELELGIK